mgnify:CR=1 FL=1
MEGVKTKFDSCVTKINQNGIKVAVPKKKPYSSLEITKYFPEIVEPNPGFPSS